eukprot:TRINITY_DN12893_c1_g2_i1.p1 TRINITY_DN12893_c1_g2~~TRINITY_DN12893_c1_g2_i1.p1  ORF type:complete len:359 (-),score=63.72 TRINITY_DN12893_c1_g2_i1:367-1443(-)
MGKRCCNDCSCGGVAPRASVIAAVALGWLAAVCSLSLVYMVADPREGFGPIIGPLGGASVALLFPALRYWLIYFSSALGALSVVSFPSAVCGWRWPLLLLAAAALILTVGSVSLAYMVHLSSAALAPSLREECLPKLRNSTSKTQAENKLKALRTDLGVGIDFVDRGLVLLGQALLECRLARPEALTLAACSNLGEETDLSGASKEFYLELERYMEVYLHCSGLCHPLAVPVFVQGNHLDDAVGKGFPPCWERLGMAAAEAGFLLSSLLGLVITPSLLVAALFVVIPLGSLGERISSSEAQQGSSEGSEADSDNAGSEDISRSCSLLSSRSSYRPMPKKTVTEVSLEAAFSPTWPPAE